MEDGAPAAPTGQDICPECRSRPLSSVRQCTGFFNAENEGRFYQICPGNTRNEATKTCGGFLWRPDVTSPPIECPGEDCSRRLKPRQRNQQCSRNVQLCATCCRLLSHLTGNTCRAVSHKVDLPHRQVTVPANGQVASNLPVSKSPSSVPPPSQTTSAAERRKGKSFGKILAPAWETRLEKNAGSFGTPFPGTSSFGNTALASQYKHDSELQLLVYWWTKDGDDPLEFAVLPTAKGYYHPRDCPIVSGTLTPTACTHFSVHDSGRWLITALPVKLSGRRKLFFRSLGITNCRDPEGLLNIKPMSGSGEVKTESEESKLSGKRRASFSTDVSITATKVRVIDLCHSDDEVEIVSSASEPPSSVPVTPLPKKQNQSPSPSPLRISSESPAQPSTLAAEIHTAPTRPGASWPLLYATDMANGFMELQRLQNASRRSGGGKKGAKDLFNRVWGDNKVFPRSIYSSHLFVWDTAKNSEEMQAAIACGRRVGGEWAPLYTKFHKRRNAEHK